jgi:HD-GYP domain-containing protein (c-di-GMP phosphodiesterase class II)
MHSLHRTDTPLPKALRPAIQMMARAHQYRDPFTSQHQERVAQFAVAIGAAMGMPAVRLEILYLAAIVHDIGKLGIPAEIVGKPGRLSGPEYALVQTHCAIGHDILLQLQAPFPIADIVHQHHERADGSGYPRGLRADAILEEARILAVADTFDAMSSYRPYRAALSEDFVLAELHKMAGQLLDRRVVDAFTRHVLSGTGLHPAIASLVEATAGQES